MLPTVEIYRSTCNVLKSEIIVFDREELEVPAGMVLNPLTFGSKSTCLHYSCEAWNTCHFYTSGQHRQEIVLSMDEVHRNPTYDSKSKGIKDLTE